MLSVLSAAQVPAVVPQLGSDGDALARARLLRRDARRADRLSDSVGVAVAAAPRPGEQRRLKLSGGDLLTASALQSRIVQVSGSKVKDEKLKSDFVPRGVDFDAATGLLAVAAVSQVVVFDPLTEEVVILEGPAGSEFAFANDVLFDGTGGLLVADEGEVIDAQKPFDGAIWRYDLTTGEFTEIARKAKLSNPKLLALDKRGVIYVIDGEAGDEVAPPFAPRWDILYEITGKRLDRVNALWEDPGIQASAYGVDDNGWHWIINLGELIRLRGTNIQQPCGVPFPLHFATGLTIDSDLVVRVIDGADVLGKRREIYEIDDACSTTFVTRRKLKGTRGITHVPE